MTPRPHYVLASRELSGFVPSGGIGRHVRFAAERLAAAADVTVVMPSDAVGGSDLQLAAEPFGPGTAVRVAPVDVAERRRCASIFHAGAVEVARLVDELHRERGVDAVEVDDYLGLGAVLVDALTTTRAARRPRLLVRLHTTWEISQVLDGRPLSGRDARWICALERRALRLADVLLAPNGETADAYARFYGEDHLAPLTVLDLALDPHADPCPTVRGLPPTDGPLRALFAGRLEERKGIRSLVSAVLDSDLDVELVVAGGDTETAPGGGSMREHVLDLVGPDPRVRLVGRLDDEALTSAYDAAHLVVLPSRFESFGYVLREALARGRPVLGTPTAGFLGPLADPRAGWLADGFDADALRRALAKVAAERERLTEMLASGAPHAALARQGNEWARHMVDAAREVVGEDDRGPDHRERITVVVHHDGGALERTLHALHGEEEDLEIIVTTERAGDVPHAVIEAVDHLLVVRPGSSLREALAVRTAAGPVLLLRAGECLRPGAVRTLHDALHAPRRPSFATAWGAGNRALDRPIGAPEGAFVLDEAAVGTVLALTAEGALLAAEADDPASWLASIGHDGSVVPEALVSALRRRSTVPPGEAAVHAATTARSGSDLWS